MGIRLNRGRLFWTSECGSGSLTWSISVGGGVSGYLAYLKKAHDWAKDWGITPAHVEYALFHRPKHS